MRLIFITLLALSGLGTARAEIAPILQSRSFLNLSVGSPLMRINYPTPGAHGKTCGVEIRTNQYYFFSRGAQALSQELKVEEGMHDLKTLPPVLEGSSIRYSFVSDGDYMTIVTISTVSGRPLAQVVEAVSSRFTAPNPRETQAIALRLECRD